MNVFQATLLFISFVAANGSFPAVIFRRMYFLAEPTMLPLSDTEVEIGFVYAKGDLYTACPLDPTQFEEYAKPKVLVRSEFVTVGETVFLDELHVCELQPQVTSKQVYQTEEYTRYSIGYGVYYKKREDDHGDFVYNSCRNNYTVAKVFTLTFNTTTKRTISVEYELVYRSRSISTASNEKHTFMYEKNEAFLGIDLDNLYRSFIHQILPRMVKEKSTNQLAHALGIQKVQLATPDDFVLDTWKMATYWNINTVPIWRVLLLRWNAIEIYIRKLHKRRMYNIEVETGSSGTLELTERHYENNTEHKLPIPKYLWKLVTYYRTKVMLIIMHNDPFTEDQQPLCEDICATNGWLISNNDYRTGLVYCCEMTEDIAQILGYSKNMKDYGIYSFTKDEDGTKNLGKITRILSEPQEKLYDW